MSRARPFFRLGGEDGRGIIEVGPSADFDIRALRLGYESLPWNMKSLRLTLPSKVGGLRGSVDSELSVDIGDFLFFFEEKEVKYY